MVRIDASLQLLDTVYDEDCHCSHIHRVPYSLSAGEWGMTWPVGRLPYPSALSVDYGQPLAPCVEVSTGSFQRAYSKGNITFDCSSLV